jgi:putative transposase
MKYWVARAKAEGLARGIAGLVPSYNIYPVGMRSEKKVRHLNIPGHAHELTFSCYRKMPLLSSEISKVWVLQAIDAARKDRGFSLYAFVIMPEHVHIIIHPHEPATEISWFLKSMKQSVARKASRWLSEHDPHRHDKLSIKKKDNRREFRFWQAGGGYDRNIENPDTLNLMIEYIHHNPVRRGLVEQAADWKWSSASWYERGECVLKIDPLSW